VPLPDAGSNAGGLISVKFHVRALFILALIGLVMGRSSHAQTSASPATDGSTNQLSVRLWLPRNSVGLHAPATIRIFAWVTSSASAQKGDVLPVDFFADAKPIGSGKAVWHEGIRPDPHSNRPQPMIVSLPGFSPASMVWSNVPAGNFVLTAQASAHGVTAMSAPASVTVLP